MNEFSKIIKFIEYILRENWWQRVRNFLFLIGEGAFDLCINLIIMVMVERTLGTAGLGVFAYLLSILIFAGFISDFGISRYLEREISFNSEGSAKIQAIEKALYAVLITSIFCAVLFFITALSDTDYTKVDEKAIAYIIIGITIPIRNFNRIRIAILQGSGKFGDAAKLKTWKRIFLFGATYFLLICHLPASILVAGYLASELGLLFKARKLMKLPALKNIWRKQNRIHSILTQSSRFLLTDETLDVVLHLDFLLLGIYVSSGDLGIYAQASILARMFLIIPISIKPVFRNQYCSLAAKNQIRTTALTVQRSTALLFFFHSVLALYILLFYPSITQTLYHVKGISLAPFYIFAQILPGLLFFSAVTSQEPIYEAEDKVNLLQNTIIIISLLNLILNFFFIPFAGYYGAAFATSASMFCYFILFGRHLSSAFKTQKYEYIIAGSAVYLTYILFQKLALSFAVSFFLVPAFLFLLFFAINFFNLKTGRIDSESVKISPETIYTKEV